jgi:hypothetical protein
MRARTSAISVPVSLIYAAASLSTGQPIIIALGAFMVVVAAGYLVSELQSRHILQNRLSASPVKASEKQGSSEMHQLGPSRTSVGEHIFPAVFVAVTLAVTVLLGAYAAGLPVR